MSSTADAPSAASLACSTFRPSEWRTRSWISAARREPRSSKRCAMSRSSSPPPVAGGSAAAGARRPPPRRGARARDPRLRSRRPARARRFRVDIAVQAGTPRRPPAGPSRGARASSRRGGSALRDRRCRSEPRGRHRDRRIPPRGSRARRCVDPFGRGRPRRRVDPAVTDAAYRQVEHVRSQAVREEVADRCSPGNSSERKKAVSPIPTGSHTRCITSSWYGMPLARSASTASTTKPPLQ
jgi:hypothetical protein